MKFSFTNFHFVYFNQWEFWTGRWEWIIPLSTYFFFTSNNIYIQQILKSGADKVGINSYAFQDLGFIKKASRKFGSQCIVSTLEVSNSINKGFFEPLN